MNRSRSIARVVRIAATLETHEAIEPTLATLPSARSRQMTKRVHAEFHQDTLDAGQVGFQLTIPSGATPDFVTSGMRLAWTVRMSFLTLSAPRPAEEGNKKRAVPPVHLEEASSSRDAFSAYHAALRGVSSLSGPHTPKSVSVLSKEDDGEAREDEANPNQEAKLEIVECAVPLHVLAHSTRFRTGSVSFTA
ncbi:Rgp1-domain-containing protein [Acaromyces ingoldii]|uniref:Rgp1-domain-containing protein n=1 Tax=Acaromyces ingoldii TaxID=215250 RepID=A0A316YYF1_9BASI|nr:Rgp1-domain-containing protein [Acaromyces ingoldii]PWN93113.1 Rgp1-domain-containing protein [Acaromyces ingoldii]